ncbi:nucleoside diphosphate kinase 6-like [Meleagris gallopavo]|uniref:nucleoside diphosphate kinase 6-like n=1 Tax=Meleagris gallopavo TaxID=9103 RepID=UPI0012AC331A|nr:nucleoside diphosphate kinase 6-like [Meleagris gallopavo]
MAAAEYSKRPLQLTLALLKPDTVAHPLVLEAVHETILSNRLLIVRAKELRCGRGQSLRFYREHAGRFFYQRLVEFMARYLLCHVVGSAGHEEGIGIPQRQLAGKLPHASQSSLNSSGTSRRSHVCAVGRCITMQRSVSTV